MNRPLAWVACALVAGTLAASYGAVSGALFPIFLVALGCLLTAVSIRNPRLRPLPVTICFFGVGAFLWQVRYEPPTADELSARIRLNPSEPIVVEGVVRTAQLKLPGEGRIYFELDVSAFGDELITGRTIVYWSATTRGVYPGERVRVTGSGRVALSEVNPGVRSYEDYLRNRGVQSAIDVYGGPAVERLAGAPWYLPWYWAARLREEQARRLALAMPESVTPFVYSVWLGYQTAIGDTEYDWYVASGMVHILSVSGVHAAIVYLTLNYLMRMLQWSQRTRALVAMIAVFAFAFVAGANVPAMRAAIMVSLYLTADLLKREPDTTTALSVAGILFVLWDPRTLFDVGFQLSFLCIASILIYQPLFAELFRRVPALIRGSVATSLAVQILPTPIVISNFHRMALTAPIANLLVIPLLASVLWLCFATSLLSFVWMPLAQIFGYATLAPIAAIRLLAQWSHALRLAPAITTPTPAALVLYWAVAILAIGVVADKRLRKRVIVPFGVLLVLCVVLWRPLRHAPEIVFLDVGQGDSAFVRTEAGETLLIDGGDRTPGRDYGKDVVAPFLWGRGITKLDAIVVTHPDRDHIGGLIYVVDHVRVELALLNPFPGTKPEEAEFLERCAARGTRVVRVKQGDRLNLGATSIEVLHPPEDFSINGLANEGSIVFSIPFGDQRVLFTGDVERRAESVLDDMDIDSDVLKVPHHGADTSSTIPFLTAVSPEYAVVSTGRTGRVTDDSIIRRYEAQGIDVWRTDHVGAIRMTMRGGEWVIEGERLVRGYPVAE